ncbi:streptophobe family protein [Streptomyces cavernae]|uniref:streptophobe family protein n=1 Tax=Streptomyces cavernae TaxID=2259034 RepID=UPI000FEBC9BC|nr:streptophobe family protein [Streptomyces cavernae]
MSAITSRHRTPRGSGPRPGPHGPARPVPQGPTEPWRNALEGAAAGLCAVVAMAAVAASALALLDAGSIGSLWSLTMAVTAMAVGGSVSAGPGGSGDTGTMGGSGLAGLFGGGGDMGPSMNGSADVVPLGVTLVGAVVLWYAFSRRLRQHRFGAGELALRSAGAGGTALLAVMIVAALGQGTVTMPRSAMSGLGGGLDMDTEGSGGGLGGGFGGGFGGGEGNPLGGLFGAGGATAGHSAMTYEVHLGRAALGAMLWVAVSLAVGCLISRRARLPLGGALDGLRSAWGRGLSAVVRTLLVMAALPLMALVLVGAVAGGRAGTAAGAALLLAPNALAVFLTLGVGSPWTAGVHPVRSEGGNPLTALMGALGGRGDGQEPTVQPDRTEHLQSLSAGGWPLWLAALTVTGVILLGCAYATARAAHPAHTRPLHPYRGPLARHIGLAERIGVVTAVVLGGAAWSAGASGRFGITVFGSELVGMRAELSGRVLWTAALGLLVGTLAGLAGSLLSAAYAAAREGRGSR